jgi:hypothetical protein
MSGLYYNFGEGVIDSPGMSKTIIKTKTSVNILNEDY